MKGGSPEAKNYATLLDKNSRQVMFVAEGFKQRFRVLSMTRREVFVSSLDDLRVRRKLYRGSSFKWIQKAVHLSQKTSHVAAEEVQAERRLPKTAWVSSEPSKEKFKTTRQDKWQIIKPLLKKYQKTLVRNLCLMTFL
ncbi:unnamed protein product [Rhizophagus irregularis]|nr:unnamed protein product [Rhizophagus irregularis]CAB5385554.1 unnamed protein product [Rhizophagus irregularis]